MDAPLHPVNDPQSDPEPAAPSLPEPDPGVFHPEPPTPTPALPPNPQHPHQTLKQ